MTEQQCQCVSGGYQETPQDHAEYAGHNGERYFYCILLNKTTIQIVND